MKRIAVFCGSSVGASPAYIAVAKELGKTLAAQGFTLVYGGASVGLMGAVANGAMQAGGQVIGVMPEFLEKREIAHSHVSELIVVSSMHERKAKMAELADGFIALPGGPGTLEEFFEIFTWAQLGLHKKPLGILNVDGYYDLLVSLFDHMADEQFMHEKHRSMTLTDTEPASLLEKFRQYEAPEVKTYIRRPEQT
ncbi:TIGR00730 family Rossman fold protein [Virgibacillus sp. 7505]|uniref:LOG family protein n=1 Tax=Virgibacillus sp. 7505 TaxID=2022548 RepID=UPI000BA58024|nr:TIGR00730 family Rossman fold protein [Virgibacillus sp. 7505]PAE17504.1 TIGR00730 family Rossman fold protein [Virgibacillus sp. 7505]